MKHARTLLDTYGCYLQGLLSWQFSVPVNLNDNPFPSTGGFKCKQDVCNNKRVVDNMDVIDCPTKHITRPVALSRFPLLSLRMPRPQIFGVNYSCYV